MKMIRWMTLVVLGFTFVQGIRAQSTPAPTRVFGYILGMPVDEIIAPDNQKKFATACKNADNGVTDASLLGEHNENISNCLSFSDFKTGEKVGFMARFGTPLFARDVPQRADVLLVVNDGVLTSVHVFWDKDATTYNEQRQLLAARYDKDSKLGKALDAYQDVEFKKPVAVWFLKNGDEIKLQKNDEASYNVEVTFTKAKTNPY